MFTFEKDKLKKQLPKEIRPNDQMLRYTAARNKVNDGIKFAKTA